MAACILSLLTITSMGTAFAQTTVIGVHPGNTFDYSYRLLWNSNDPTATVPAEYVDLNKTQSIRISIVSVSGSLVNVDIAKHFKNGTVTKQNGNLDVNSQVIEIPYGVLIIRAAANPNEKIYPVGGHATLGETT